MQCIGGAFSFMDPLELTKSLVALETPTGSERPATDFLDAALSRAGYTTLRQQVSAGRRQPLRLPGAARAGVLHPRRLRATLRPPLGGCRHDPGSRKLRRERPGGGHDRRGGAARVPWRAADRAPLPGRRGERLRRRTGRRRFRPARPVHHQRGADREPAFHRAEGIAAGRTSTPRAERPTRRIRKRGRAPSRHCWTRWSASGGCRCPVMRCWARPRSTSASSTGASPPTSSRRMRPRRSCSVSWSPLADSSSRFSPCSRPTCLRRFPVELPFYKGGTAPAGWDTTVVSFSSDLPFLTSWGEGYQLGPGTIRVAHSAHEHIRKADLLRGVELYVRLATDLLARESS